MTGTGDRAMDYKQKQTNSHALVWERHENMKDHKCHGQKKILNKAGKRKLCQDYNFTQSTDKKAVSEQKHEGMCERKQREDKCRLT